MKVEEALKNYILSKYKSIRAFTQDIEVPYSTVDTMFKRGISGTSVSTMLKICSALNLDIDRLEHGEIAEKINYHNSKLTDKEYSHIENYRKLDDRGKNIVDTVMNTELNYIEQVNKQSIKEYSSDNIFNLRMSELKASAGTGNLLSDEVVKYIQVQLNHTTRQADFCIPVSGDSMQPKFYDGDILLVRSQPDIDIGEIGIYIVNSNGFVKKKGSDRLISINPEYKDILLSEFDNIKCCGKVIGKLDREWIK